MIRRHRTILLLRHANQVRAAAVPAESINMKKHSRKIIATAIVLAAAGFIIAQQNDSAVISVQETRNALNNDSTIVLLDVRTPQENSTERIADTPLIPLQELRSRIDELRSYKNKKIIVYCRSGHRSGIATELLRSKGFNAVSMTGGINQWKAEGYSTLKGNGE